MPTPSLAFTDCKAAVDAFKLALREGYVRHGQPSAIAHAASQLGITRKRMEHRLRVAAARYQLGAEVGVKAGSVTVPESTRRRLSLDAAQATHAAPKLPDFPDDDIPDSEIIEMMCRRSARRIEHKAAKKWFRIEMPSDDPFAVMWWGDPHLDSNGTNWTLLKEHVELAKEPGVYSINIGDTLDNWPSGSRLMRLYADSDASVQTAHKLARWFMRSAGINWLVWLLGNHDSWGGRTTPEWYREVGRQVIVEDWGAQFVLATPGGAEFKVWAAHNFPGTSQWNSLHGLQKAAHMKEEADIYVCGHRHNWALHKEESASKGFTYSLIRTRGYKFLDEYAENLGHFPQQHGASIVTVFDPARGRHHSFEHPEDGLDFLQALRMRNAA